MLLHLRAWLKMHETEKIIFMSRQLFLMVFVVVRLHSTTADAAAAASDALACQFFLL